MDDTNQPRPGTPEWDACIAEEWERLKSAAATRNSAAYVHAVWNFASPTPAHGGAGKRG